MKNVIVERVIHDGESRVVLRFPYDTELIALVKGLPDAKWSRTMNCWHLPDNPDALGKIVLTLGDKAKLDTSAISGSAEDSADNKAAGGKMKFLIRFRNPVIKPMIL
jgi:hypothetical protein